MCETESYTEPKYVDETTNPKLTDLMKKWG
jgi:hypothetical protein